MKAFRLMLALGILAPLAAIGQTVPSEPLSDPVMDALQEFNQNQEARTDEVMVVPVPQTAADKPVLVTGKPPGNVETISDKALTPPAGKPIPTPIEQPPLTEEKGLSVDVEKLQSGKGIIQTGEIKLLAPFPAKPLSAIPKGWKLDAQANVPPLIKEVELSPGKKISLTIRPHLLIPETDGATSFSIKETGYQPAEGYQQTATVGAILSRSIRQLDDDAKQLGSAIDNLQQLLVSLPTPEPPPAAVPPPSPSPKR